MGSNLWVVLPTAASSSSQQLIHPDDEDEAIPGYRPPSVPPPVRLSTADPEPWRTGEPPPRCESLEEEPQRPSSTKD